MREDWKFDQECLIDSCTNDDLIDEIGLPELRKVVVIELRKVKPTPHIAPYMHLIDGEPVYLRPIGEGWSNGRLRPALMLAYTLHKRMIQPLWVFKASEAGPEDEAPRRNAAMLDLVRIVRASRTMSESNAPLPKKLERKLAAELRNARRRRKH